VNYTTVVNENKVQVLKENTRIYPLYSLLLFLTGALTVLLASVFDFGLFFGPIIGIAGILYYVLMMLGIIPPDRI